MDEERCPHCAGTGRKYHLPAGWMRETREAAGRTVADVARDLRVRREFLSRVEHGHEPCPGRIGAFYMTELAHQAGSVGLEDEP